MLMYSILTSPIFYVFITVGSYFFFSFIYKKTKCAICNPLLLASASIILYLLVMKADVTKYKNDLSIINVFLSPLTVCLAIPIFARVNIIKKYYLPIIVGTITGVAVSMTSIYLLGNVFKLDDEIIKSMLPKSVTTPIAIEISQRIGGIEAITIFVVVITGVLGSLLGPTLLKLLKIKRSPSIGTSLGGTSHAIGTSKAVEISTRAGAIASVTLVTSGILTVIVSLFI